MNILVIGNGFDLAHRLPTKYMDFLFFCYAVKRITEDSGIDDNVLKDDEKFFSWLNNNKKILSKINIGKSSYMNGFHHYKQKVTEREEIAYNGIIDDFVVKLFLDKDKNAKLIEEIINLIFGNFWVKYFLQCDMHGNENWIDFESEISNVVKSITDKMHGLNKDSEHSLYDKVSGWPCSSNDFFWFFWGKEYGKDVTYKEIRDKLERDLDKLIRVFEIYLTEYVEKINVKIIAPDIKDMAAILHDDSGQKGILFSKVISFNYTNIYEHVYLGKYNIDCSDYVDYIHGEANISNAVETNNMVLGIDEYLPKKRRNKETEFITFKKYYQRIYKGTGSKYKDWINAIRKENDIYMERKHDCEIFLKNGYGLTNEIEDRRAELKQLNQNPPRHNLYIFGHSLDITDKDVLKDLILNDNVYTTIYYPDKEELGRKIANLVKVIGQKELIRRTGGNTKTIVFEPQQKMEPIKSQQSEENRI